jgi:hypothetical protein
MKLVAKILRNGTIEGYLVQIPTQAGNLYVKQSIREAVTNSHNGELEGSEVFKSSAGYRVRRNGRLQLKEISHVEADKIISRSKEEANKNTIVDKNRIVSVGSIRPKGKLIYHGTFNREMVPKYEFGKEDSDFGRGFYTTEDLSMGKEWACQTSNMSVGYVHFFDLVMPKDCVYLDLTTGSSLEQALKWLDVILRFRMSKEFKTSGRLKARYDELHIRFGVNIDNCDITEGWRADDKYFVFAKQCFIGAISLEGLAQSMQFGGMGKQVVLHSKRSYSMISRVEGSPIMLDGKEYQDTCIKYTKRCLEADLRYQQLEKMEMEKRTKSEGEWNKLTYLDRFLGV